MKALKILFLIIGLAVLSNAQNATEKSILIGHVFDEFGMGIPQSKLIFTDGTGQRSETSTDKEGSFRIEIDGGKYRIEIQGEGFRPFLIENYEIAFKTKMQLDVSLDVAPAVDTVTISPTIKRRADDLVLVSGIVTLSGKLVDSANVQFTDERGLDYAIKTDGHGRYEIKLPTGKYRVSASGPNPRGFVGLGPEFHKNDLLVSGKVNIKLNIILSFVGEG